MPLRDSVQFVWNVLVIIVLGLVYVAGLTAGTLVGAFIQAVSAIAPTSGRDQTTYTARR